MKFFKKIDSENTIIFALNDPSKFSISTITSNCELSEITLIINGIAFFAIDFLYIFNIPFPKYFIKGRFKYSFDKENNKLVINERRS